MADDKTISKKCVSCGVADSTGTTDKLKFKNKKGGTIFIHYKKDDKKGMLCRSCWQKNLKSFHDKIEKSLSKK